LRSGRIALPTRVGTEVLDTLYAILDYHVPSAIAAIDPNRTWVIYQREGGTRVALEIYPGGLFGWKGSKRHAGFEIPTEALRDVAGVWSRLMDGARRG
jgi:hypothetical protein